MVSPKRKIEIFIAACSLCDETVSLVTGIACELCEIVVFDMRKAEVAGGARYTEVRSVPAVAIDGKLADGCAGRWLCREMAD